MLVPISVSAVLGRTPELRDGSTRAGLVALLAPCSAELILGRDLSLISRHPTTRKSRIGAVTTQQQGDPLS